MTLKEKQTLSEVLPSSKKIENKTKPFREQEVEKSKTLLHLLRLGIITAILIIFGLIFVAWGTYSEEWQNSFVESVYKVVPYPAAAAGYGNWITLYDYNKNVKAMRQFLESKEAALGENKFDFSTEDGLKRLAIIKKNILGRLIDNKIMENLAKQQGVTVSEAELSDTTEKILSRDGKKSENITQLSSLYGWRQEDFKERVIKDLLYKQKLEDKIKTGGELNKDVKERVALIQAKLTAGENFSELASNHSDSSSRQSGGLLPAFSREDSPRAFSDIPFKLAVGEISQPIEANDGWHFVRLERKFQEDGKEKVEVRHIMIRKKTIDDWLKEKRKEFKITVFLRPYFWHEQMGKLYFKDDSLNQLEQELNRNSLNEKTQEADFLLNVNRNR